MEVASWEPIHTNLGGILAPAKTVKPQALPARVILVAGAATRDEAASDTPRPDARDLPEACSVSQSRNSDASFLTANPGGVAIADAAWAYGSCIIYTKYSSRSFNYALGYLQCAHHWTFESEENTCEDECSTLEFDMETMRA